jgi:diguanylate cyclase (GGDEF)-like protein
MLAVLSVCYFLAMISSLEWYARLAIQETIYCLPIVATVILGFVATRRATGVERRFWALLSSANAVLLFCEFLLIWWIVAVDRSGPPPVSPVFHLLHLVAAVLFIALLSGMSRTGEVSWATWIRQVVDVCIVGLVAALALLEFYVQPVMTAAGAPSGHVFVALGYPVFGLIMLLGMLANIVGFRARRWRTWDTLIASALGAYAIAIMTWPLWYSTVTSDPRNFERGLLDITQFSGHWILMMAVIYRLTTLDDASVRRLPPTKVEPSLPVALGVPLVGLFGIPFAVHLLWANHTDPVYVAALGSACVALAILLGVRSTVVSFEHTEVVRSSTTDPITGVYTARFFSERLEYELTLAAEAGENLAVMMVDIDDFSDFNAEHGHAAGDRLLAQVGRLIHGVCGRSYAVARLAGDRFAVIAPSCGVLEATVLARKILDVISIEAGPAPGSVTASAGIAMAPLHSSESFMLRTIAAAALRDAKSSGKRHVVVYDDARVPDIDFERRIDQLERSSRTSAAAALAAAAEAVSPAHAGHAHAVAELSAAVAERVGLSEEAVGDVRVVALLHDIAGFARAAAASAGATEAAAEDTRGVERLLESAGLFSAAPGVRAVREWWDGSGRPNGLAGEEIPFEARVVAPCDEYLDLTSGIGQGSPLPRELALARIERSSGIRFDPAIVGALRTVLLARAARAPRSTAAIP